MRRLHYLIDFVFVEPDAVTAGAAVNFRGVVSKQLVVGHGHAAPPAKPVAGAKRGAEVLLVIVLVYAVMMLGNRLI